jgi:RNA polymerase sigma-70 factor (ECF subfamily)
MARGDAAALGVLYDRFAPVLLALTERIVGRGTEAEDLVQEVFLEAWRKSASYDPKRASVKAWLLLRARSRCLDHKKSARVSRRAQGSDGAWLEQLADPDNEPSLAPDRAKIREVLLGLPAEQRAVLLLGYFEGLSSSEMAEHLGIPIGTVKSRAAAALAALRASLTRSVP